MNRKETDSQSLERLRAARAKASKTYRAAQAGKGLERYREKARQRQQRFRDKQNRATQSVDVKTKGG